MLGVVEILQSFFERDVQIGLFAEFQLTAFLSIFTKLVHLALDGRRLLHLAHLALLNAVFVKFHLVVVILEFGFARIAYRIDLLVASNRIARFIFLHFAHIALV